MDYLVTLFFALIDVFDVRSGDPALAAFKHARRAIIICGLTLVVLIALAFACAPAHPPGVSHQASYGADVVRDFVSNAFALGAVAFMIATVYYALRCLHTYLWPERYVDWPD